MKKELQIFLTAMMFYTRIPVPRWVNHDAEYLNKATKYFPLIGWIVGVAVALVFMGANYLFSPSVAIILSMVVSVLLTGAFHEDGFADVCDGFGGGWTKEKILLIMKDSRVGAYGVIGLIFMLSIKFYLLSSFSAAQLTFVLIAAHAISRWAAASFILTHQYVRENEDSKAKPVAKQFLVAHFLIASLFGILPLLLFKNVYVFLLIIPVYTMKIYLGWYFKKWIGGYTGDCLGATQQLCEIIFYLSLLALWKFI
ncbi:adenosylcobinamide-GDP ribazoletransferase [Ferruginibacter paludis]|uniref:adenosylcobinamide-GDP ribazoletransferase n=1 Tax=Ferruginibacter paludis TaxID=1310417 RepID=UPI0025B5C10A|nr:adenosylcobinamide-GDP ribazoletransferase [Ferruginibacter paludis]MDN3654100.1 adenosylcobinamide-GDP ribazoletransferase [Ferruginibacter paludis]